MQCRAIYKLFLAILVVMFFTLTTSCREVDLPESKPEAGRDNAQDTAHSTVNVDTKAQQDLAAIRAREPEDLEPPLIAITFDDGFETDYLQAYPLLKKRKMVATTYITTGLIGKKGHLDWTQVRALREAGWTIGCHTHNHPWLTHLSKDEIAAEMQEVNRAFLKAGLSTPDHHAYPFGDVDRKTIEVIRQYRLTGRAIPTGRPPAGDDIDYYRLQAHQLYLDSEQALKELKALLDGTVEKQDVLILYTHEVKAAAGKYGAKPLYLARLLDYITELGFTVVNMDELYAYLEYMRENHADISN